MDNTKKETKKIGSTMVVGAGIAGMQAALDLADAGIKVYLVESASAIGGRMAQLDKTFPTNECSMCIVSPKLVDCERHINIDILTNTEVQDIAGDAGSFQVTLHRRARHVDIDKCTGCDECTKVCPVEVPNKFDGFISKHKAIYRMYPQAVPRTFAIDKQDTSPCVATCPAHIHIQGYIALIAQGKYKEAYELIRSKVPFPGILGRVCYHPCEGECNRKDMEGALAVNQLKRFVTDFVYESKESELFPQQPDPSQEPSAGEKSKARQRPYSFDKDITEELVKERNSRKVAVVGAGPSGLTAAYNLHRWGYSVTVFEREDNLGGLMRYGIPSYRLPDQLLQREIDSIVNTGFEVKSGVQLGKDFTLSSLKKDGYEAVLLAVGASKPKELRIPGYDLKNVTQGIDFLKKVNCREEVSLKGKVVVIGGGNVAIDTARASLRLGANQVDLYCLESESEMPAHPWEIQLAREEGVVIHNSYGPKEIVGGNGAVSKVRFSRCLRVFDDEHKFNPVFADDEQIIVNADQVIFAIGQGSDTSFLREGDMIERAGWGGIKIDPVTYATSQKGIFASGDVALGPASVIYAIASGRESAVSIDRYLRGVDLREGREETMVKAPTPQMEFSSKPRVKTALLPLAQRRGNFNEVELTLSESDAVAEASRCLNCAICSGCYECEKVCEACAISHDMRDETLNLDVGAVIFSTGLETFDANRKKEYGADRYANVVTSVQFERFLSSSGPTQGMVVRPSDGQPPRKIAFIQCVGSRNPADGNEFCSSVCCMYSIKEATIALEHDANIQPAIFYIDIRCFGKDYERYYEDAEKNKGVRFIRSTVSKVYEKYRTKNLVIRYVDEAGRVQEEEFDMVVLAVGLLRSEKFNDLAEKLNFKLNGYDVVDGGLKNPGTTTRPGIFAVGTTAEPKDIPESVVEGSSAAALASSVLCDVRGQLVKKKKYPPEKNVSDEDVRVGVFICRCGKNIASVVNVPEVVDYASHLKDVAYASEFLYTCSKDALEGIKESIEKYKLNRVIVASCTPRTHEALFRDTVREVGLNRYLFEMTSLREQVSWVHQSDPVRATQKAKELVKIKVAKARLFTPLKESFADVNHTALVVGGGAAGMHAALTIADQGFEVCLLEKSDELGGHLKELFFNPQQPDLPSFLNDLVRKVTSNEKIMVLTNAQLKETTGFVGNYRSLIDCATEEMEIEHGVVLIATGAQTYQPEPGEYGYGKSDHVFTQVDLERRLTQQPGDFAQPKTFVMIQCVGSRNENHPYCSRVCCMNAIKNALKLKEINPRHKIYVLYRDIRTYGLMEKYYTQAREKGIIFLCFKAESAPVVTVQDDKITVDVSDELVKENISLHPDHVVLSVGVTSGDNEDLARRCKISLNRDGFFLEAHPKIRPLDFTTDGMFLCGMAHSPRFLQESLVQAQGAAMRACTILSKDTIEAKAIIACVDERLCQGCGLCVAVCPFDAREMDEENKVARVIEVSCQGCGACVVVCRSRASTHKGFTQKQILSMAQAAVDK